MILATIKQIKQEQLILVQGEDSKKGQLIYLTRKGSFQVILYKMIRFLSGKLKKHTKLAKIVKISIFVNPLVFPMNFNRFSLPMTLTSNMFNFFSVIEIKDIESKKNHFNRYFRINPFYHLIECFSRVYSISKPR